MTPTRWFHIAAMFFGIACVLIFDNLFLPEITERFYPKSDLQLVPVADPNANRLSEALLSIPLFDRWLVDRDFTWTSGKSSEMKPTSWNYRIGVYFQLYVFRILLIAFFIQLFIVLAINIVRNEMGFWPFDFAASEGALADFFINMLLPPGIIAAVGLWLSICWIITIPVSVGLALLVLAHCVRIEIDIQEKEKEKRLRELERKREAGSRKSTPASEEKKTAPSRKAAEHATIIADIINRETSLNSETCYKKLLTMPEKALELISDAVSRPRTYRGLPLSEAPNEES